MRQGLRPADIRLEQQPATTARGMRRPEFNTYLSSANAYQLVPLTFTPVLAGDTVANCSISARIIAAEQANNQVLGAWFEFWLFYVRIGDMADAENIRSLLIDPSATATINWRQQCMDAIWKGYFMDEGDGTNTWSISRYLRNPRVGWWDSARDADSLPDVSGEPDDWSADWVRYQAMRRAKLTTKTWEEYLATQGINVPPQLRQEHDPEAKLPELVQYSREYVYPQMSMAPSSGGSITPQATLQWFINDKLKRSRFCAEPGFFVSCMTVRPKRYIRSYNSAGNDTVGTVFDPLTMLNDAGGWMPMEFDTDPHTALRTIPATYFGDTVGGADYVIDTRDQLLYGFDEWLNANVRNSAVAADAPPSTVINPVLGSPPSAAPLTYVADVRLKYGIKSRVNKDVTR